MAENLNPLNEASIHKLYSPRLLGVAIDGKGHATVGFKALKNATYVGPYETLFVDNTPGHTICIHSAGADVYLRMDASEVKDEYQHNGCFGARGIVNCQSNEFHGAYEEFYFIDQGQGRKAIASVAFPGRYLSLYFEEKKDGTPGMRHIRASCQYGIGETELFWVKVL